MSVDHFWDDVGRFISELPARRRTALLPGGNWELAGIEKIFYNHDAVFTLNVHCDVYVIHKGMIPTFHQAFIRRLLDEAHYALGNEVFCVFTVDSTHKMGDLQHLDPLRTYVDPRRVWRDQPRPCSFIHIPKTAGTTVWSAMTAQIPSNIYFSSDETLRRFEGDINAFELVGGHIHADTLLAAGWKGQNFTVLRDPVERAMSLIAHARRNRDHIGWVDESFTSASEDYDGISPALKSVLLAEANQQVTMLGARESELRHDAADLGRALSRSLALLDDSNWTFGLQEDMAATADMVAQVLHIPRPDFGWLNGTPDRGTLVSDLTDTIRELYSGNTIVCCDDILIGLIRLIRPTASTVVMPTEPFAPRLVTAITTGAAGLDALDDRSEPDLRRMDRYWRDVVGFVARSGLSETSIVAPDAFAPALTLRYHYEDGASINETDVLILHKGTYTELRPTYVRQALDTLFTAYANEVFIVLSRREPTAVVDIGHVDELESIGTWARANSYEDGTEPVLRMVQTRMPTSYVGKGRVLLETAFGQLMLASGEDTSITPHLIRDGWFDPGLTKFFNHSLAPGMTYVDVGANFGTYALIAAAIVGPAGQIVAIEANARIAEILYENLVMNGFKERSDVLRVAAGDAEGVATMFEFAIRHGGNTLVRDVAERAQAEYAEQVRQHEVPCRPLDAMLADCAIKRIDFLKIDVEGYELQVLKGARNTIAALQPALVVEWHPAFIDADHARALHEEICGRHGYRLERIEGDGGTRPIDFDELMALEHSDILARPHPS